VPDTDPSDQLLRRLLGGVPGAAAEVVAGASTSGSVPLVTAAALLARDRRLLARATVLAATAQDRQLVVLADTYLRGDGHLLDVLLRDHLTEHPDQLLAAWIAGLPAPQREESS
jgi:hypothetical protein